VTPHRNVTPPTQLELFGRFVWKLLVVLLVTLAVLAVVGVLVRLVFGLDVTEVR
jgi:L-cystine uptake protein TcyP (sodium:dicarboxylate symporter family)